MALVGATSCASDGEAPGKHNLIAILADDMRHDETPFMPGVLRHFVDQGVSFSAARHNISLCSPARAGFLTGQLSLRHRVRSQSDPFRRDNDDQETVAVWLQRAGYHTGQIGKYFTGGNQRAAGWDVRRQLSANPQSARGFSVWDGETESHPDDDQTTYLHDEVVRFVTTAPEPFFLWFTPTANHWPLEPSPGFEDAQAELQWPDLREPDVSDKPLWIRELPPLVDDDLALIRGYQRGRIRELLGLDQTVTAVFDALESRSVLDRTVAMFSSDNGVFAGEHRLPPLSKNLPYEPSVRVPCFLRAPGLAPATVVQPAHMSVDLTATCVQVAGAQPDLEQDGVSLLDLALDPSSFDERRLLYDRDDRDNGALRCPPAAGVFTLNRKLIRYESSPRTFELYDLERDPEELENLADDPRYAEERRELEASLDELVSQASSTERA